MRCYWEYLKEDFGNCLGTHREHTENKKSPKPKEKTKAPMNLLIGSGTVCLHFQPGLIPPNYERGVIIVSVPPTSCVCIFYMIP